MYLGTAILNRVCHDSIPPLSVSKPNSSMFLVPEVISAFLVRGPTPNQELHQMARDMTIHHLHDEDQ